MPYRVPRERTPKMKRLKIQEERTRKSILTFQEPITFQQMPMRLQRRKISSKPIPLIVRNLGNQDGTRRKTLTKYEQTAYKMLCFLRFQGQTLCKS